MSDEPKRTGEEPARVPSGIWEHTCEHPDCLEWGGWGHSNGRVTRWFCTEHRPEDIWADM